MSFGQPLWFFAFALLPALAALFFRNERRRGALLRQLVAARLRDRLAGSVSEGKRRWRFGILLLGLACVILSLAQPRLGSTWEESRRKGRDVLIAIDCSRSMLSTDVSPNRLARAKLAAQDLIGLLGGDRVGLIAFAGTSFLQAPLTADYGAVLNSLAEIDTDIIPRGGTDITAAIKEASDAFGKGESDNRCLILMTDGEDLEEDAIKAAEGQSETMRIFTVGLGSTDGSLIPLPGAHGGTEFVKDDSGQIVKSRLDEERLRKIAETTGGFYVHLLSGPAEMKQIATEGLGKMKEKDIDVKMSHRPIERYQWPLAAGIALIAGSMLMGERKRAARRPAAVAAALTVGLTMLSPAAVQAKNSGLEAYDREDYSGAQEQFSDQLKRLPDSPGLQFDLGAAAYKSGDFGKALETFAKAVTSTSQPLREAAEYNLGNTLYQRGAAQKDKEPKIKEWKNALQHYDQALNIDPQNKDARYNRDLLQRLMDELEKKEQQQQQQQQKDKDKDKDKDKKGDKDQKQDQQQQQKGNDQKGQQKDSQQSQSQDQKSGQQDQDQKQPQSGSSKPDQNGQGQQQEKKDQGNPSQPQNEGQGQDQKSAQNQPPKDGKGGEQAKNDPSQGKEGNQDPPAQGAEGKDAQEKKNSGEIKAQGAQPPPDAQQQEAEEAQAAKEGKMTETQARELLESLRNEDFRLPLRKPDERKNNARAFKDW